MSVGRAVVLSNGTIGEKHEREVVWIVSVRADNGLDDPAYEWRTHLDEDDAEDEAAALASQLGLSVDDQRDGPPSNVIPFRRPEPR